MIALFLALVLGTSTPQPIRVDVLEINTFRSSGDTMLKQALLRRWMRLPHGNGHYIGQWRLVLDESQPFWRHGKRLVTITTSDGTHTLETRSLRETTTPFDPELRERPIYSPEQRRAYLQAVTNE